MNQKIPNVRVRMANHRSLTRAVTGSVRAATAVLAGLLLVAGCATDPVPPNEALRAAEQAIGNAERERVADYAAVELAEAREMLVAARSAVDREDMVRAERLAKQSRADAELASAKAGAARAQAVNEDMKSSTDILKQEMQRNTGARE